nr:hypothetical protein [Tanacetum cinerariifolium]
MVIQSQSKLGEGSTMPIDPHHTPTILQPSSSQPQKTQKPRKPKRKDTQVPQPSGPTESGEWSESVSKYLNDSLLARGNTLQSDEDSLKLNELLELCTNLQNKVLDLEKTKTSQSEDASKQGRRIDAINVNDEITLVNDVDNEMFDVGDLGGEEVFVAEQQVVSTAATTETITTEEITLAQALEALKTLKPKAKGIVFHEAGKSTTTTTPIISSQQSQDKGKVKMIEERVKPKKKDQIRLDEEAALKLQAKFDEEERLATLVQQLLEKSRKHFTAKREEEKRKKTTNTRSKGKIICTYLKNMKGYKLKDMKLKEFDKIQEMFDRAFKRINTFEDIRIELVKGKEKRAREELIQDSTKKQKVEDDKEKA